MKETIKESVVDNYLEHSQHNNYDEHCSECAKNIAEFDGKDDICKNCGVPCYYLYCDKCDKEITDYEFSRQDN